MDKKTRKTFEEILKKLKTEKEDIIKSYEEQLNSNDYNNSETSNYPYHSADIGTDAAMMERNTINMNKIREELRMIDEALSKISDSSYGVCEMCGEEITKKRLNAIPYVKFCIDCMEKSSRR